MKNFYDRKIPEDWFTSLPAPVAVKRGDRVICNGYHGAVTEVKQGKLEGMCAVRLDSGEVAADIRELRVFPETSGYSECRHHWAKAMCPTCNDLEELGAVSPMLMGAFWIVPAVWLLMHFAVGALTAVLTGVGR